MLTAAVHPWLALSSLPEPLVSKRARARLLELASSASASADVDLIYVEHRVGEDATDQVDVSLGAAAFVARAALAREVAALAERQGSAWAAASRTFERWCRRGTTEASALGAACLEYDLPLEARGGRAPSVFFNLAGLSHCWDLGRTRRELSRLIEWVTGNEGSSLLGPLEVVLGALPGNFQLAHLGFMFSRSDEALRFDVALPRPELEAVSRRLGWGGSLAGCGGFLALAERSGWVTLALGMGPRVVHPRVGVEAFPRAGRGGADGLLEALVEGGWCARDKARAASGWLASQGGAERRALSHAKLVIDEAGHLETKLYLTLAPRDASLGRLASLRQIRGRATPARGGRPPPPCAEG